MSYLESIKEQAESRRRYEEGCIKLKELVMKSEVLHNQYNGEFLADLQKFLENYQPND